MDFDRNLIEWNYSSANTLRADLVICSYMHKFQEYKVSWKWVDFVSKTMYLISSILWKFQKKNWKLTEIVIVEMNE